MALSPKPQLIPRKDGHRCILVMRHGKIMFDDAHYDWEVSHSATCTAADTVDEKCTCVGGPTLTVWSPSIL